MMEQYRNLPVTVMGLGRFGGGVAAAKFLAEHGATVTVTDLRSADELAESLNELSDVKDIRYELGGHPDRVFSECQMLVVNPAVRFDHPQVVQARSLGIDVTTEIELFIRHNPAPVIAVSGSNGKSTTTALIHHLLQHASDFNAWLGGNIGVSLLPVLDQVQADDLVVLEVSSFQLEALRRNRFRPQIAVLTNFSPNHLDWHGSVDAYRAAKQGLFDAQIRDDVAIVPSDEIDGFDSPGWRTRAHRFVFGTSDDGSDGVFVIDGDVTLRSARGQFEESFRLSIPPQLPGIHNRWNIAAACCAAWQAGADPECFSQALRSFVPLPHRLQKVAESGGRQFWNDSIATTPESAIMALRVFSGNLVLLAGGYDKGQDLTEFAKVITERARAVVMMGQTADTLSSLVKAENQAASVEIRIAEDFKDAFSQAVALSREGDIVLLSPGCASYGWFKDYRERGDMFTQLARTWRFESK